MAQVINTNIPSLNSQRNLDKSTTELTTALQRLSSGLRINSAKDDAAGLAISQRMTAQIRGMGMASRNSNDGVSLAQTAEGALGEMGSLLQRIRELSVQSINGTNSVSDRQALNAEVGQLVSELQRFATTTAFNNLKLFDGTMGAVTYQVGANVNETITATSANFLTTKYGTYQVKSQHSATVLASDTASGYGDVVSSASGTFTINGTYGSGLATFRGGSSDSAKSIAASINGQSQTGVRAFAKTEVDLTEFIAGQSFALNVAGSNEGAPVVVSFTVGADGSTADGLAGVVQAFNDQASKTSITARLNDAGNGVILTASDGSNIFLGQSAAGAGSFVATSMASGANGYNEVTTTQTFASGAATGIVVMGQVTLDSDKAYSITQTDAATGLFLDDGTSGNAAGSLQAVAQMDVSTVTGANLALRIVDSALTSVNAQRASFGAVQNRFMATISNLSSSIESLSAARSRIQDADFAAETANMTRAQILQQAGTAMLAQANALPQGVLSLLK